MNTKHKTCFMMLSFEKMTWEFWDYKRLQNEQATFTRKHVTWIHFLHSLYHSGTTCHQVHSLYQSTFMMREIKLRYIKHFILRVCAQQVSQGFHVLIIHYCRQIYQTCLNMESAYHTRLGKPNRHIISVCYVEVMIRK